MKPFRLKWIAAALLIAVAIVATRVSMVSRPENPLTFSYVSAQKEEGYIEAVFQAENHLSRDIDATILVPELRKGSSWEGEQTPSIAKRFFVRPNQTKQFTFLVPMEVTNHVWRLCANYEVVEGRAEAMFSKFLRMVKLERPVIVYQRRTPEFTPIDFRTLAELSKDEKLSKPK